MQEKVSGMGLSVKTEISVTLGQWFWRELG
jgi:hypothetical protein